MIRRTLTKAYGTAIIARHLIGQRRNPYIPDDQLSELRDKRLRQMVRYAAETVPFYRDFFVREGLDPAEIHSAADLHRLPLIDKKLVQQRPERFVSASRWGRTAIPFPTTGSTGTPLTVLHDRHSLLTNAAYSEREREAVRDVLGGRDRFRVVAIDYETSTGNQSREFLRQHTFLPVSGNRFSLFLTEPIEHIIAAVNRIRPEVIASYGSFVELLFRTLAARGIQMHLPKVVLFGSDMMTDAGRRLIESQFGVVVLSRYNAVEAFKIGFSCRERTGYHLHDDLTHVRLVDKNGNAVAPGEQGEVVISNLVNRGTVLLNYRLGDLASTSHERCPCGRNLPLLAGLEGRVEDIIHLRDGTYVHPRQVCAILETRSEVVQYQLIQHQTDSFELRIATVDRAAFEKIGGAIVADLRRLLGQAVAIDAVHHEQLEPMGRARKLRPVLSLVNPQNWPR
ncbi:MAG: phenylacetate--CoA ligase family protein [Anaerolineales bacterium]|nr:MAG: phenylacetate--CoA ligase family protein [Anaerolineales bacterium]